MPEQFSPANVIMEQMRNIGKPLVSTSTSTAKRKVTEPEEPLDFGSLIMMLMMSGLFGQGQGQGGGGLMGGPYGDTMSMPNLISMMMPGAAPAMGGGGGGGFQVPNFTLPGLGR